MFCPKCGSAVQDNTRFCGGCGQVVAAQAAPQDSLGTSPPPPPPPGGAALGGAAAGAASDKPLAGLVERVKNILLAPKTEWPVIAAESTSITQLYKGYFIPLAALAALMSFIRLSVIGISLPFGETLRTPFFSGLAYAVLSFVFGLVGLYLVGLIINGLAPTFGGIRDQRQALKTAAYAFTPAALSSVLAMLPAFATLLQLAAGLYGIYLLYLGLPCLMRNPREKATGYTAAVVVCTILVGVVFSVLSAVTGGVGAGGGFGGLPRTTMLPEQRQERAAAAVGGMLGAALGTDDKGKANLTAAIGNLAAAGQKLEQEQNAASTAADTSTAAAGGGTGTAVPQNAVAATAGLLTALGGAMAGSRHVEPVDFHVLKDLLPASLPDMQRIAAQGNSQQAMGVKGSSATADYQGPANAHVQVKIADLSGVAGLLDMAASVAAGQSSESDTGYEKNTTLDGRSVHEKYDNPSRHGEINVIVAKRFGVDVTGDGVAMTKLEQYASNIDFGRLESMRDVGAQSQ